MMRLRAIYKPYTGEEETVVIIALLITNPELIAEAVFVWADGTMGQDMIGRFTIIEGAWN